MAKKIDLKPSVAKTQAQNALSSMLSGGSASGRVVDLDLDALVPWSSEQYHQDVQPFSMYTPDELQDLANSIKRNGVQQPIIVRPMGDKYQILAGHNRTEAAKLANLKMIPAIVRDVDEATAMLIVVDTNLNQRQEMKPSQKAHAYQLRNDVIASQGKSNKKSTAEIAEMTGENLRQVQRFLRLNQLDSDLLTMVDSERLSVRAGVNLSYLSSDQQKEVFVFLSENPTVPLQIPESEALKNASQNGGWTAAVLRDILSNGQQRIASIKEQQKKSRVTSEPNSQDNPIRATVPTELSNPAPKSKDNPVRATSPTELSNPTAPESATNGRIIPLPFSVIADYFSDPNPSDEDIITVIKAHFDYLHEQFGEQFMSVYRTEKMAEL